MCAADEVNHSCAHSRDNSLRRINLIFIVQFKPIFSRAPYGGGQRRENRARQQATNNTREGVTMKTVVKTVEPADRQARFDHIRPLYLDALTLVERLHRRLLDVIKDEFDRRGRSDINSVQALLLYNIGDKELTAGELRTRGYYLGSNVSYNLKKLVEMGFLDHQRSRVDRRSVRIRLTDTGREVRDIVEALYQKHVRTVEQVGGINADEFATLNKSLHRLERFWTDQILYRL
jgi:DNA-binding MarR family transcriptional regulator